MSAYKMMNFGFRICEYRSDLREGILLPAQSTVKSKLLGLKNIELSTAVTLTFRIMARYDNFTLLYEETINEKHTCKYTNFGLIDTRDTITTY